MRATSSAQGSRGSQGTYDSLAREIMINSVDSYDIRLATPTSCDKYPAKHHARNVARKLKASSGLIFLSGQPTINLRDSDQSRPFRQRRYFYYLSGVNEPDCSLTYDIEQDLLTLYVPDFDLHRAIWMGPTLSREDALDQYDVDRVHYQTALREGLQTWLDERTEGSELYLVHQSEKPDHLPADAPLELEKLMPAMDAARGIKDEYEIRMIRQANKVSGLAHREILKRIQSFSNESEIEGSFLDTCVSNGARNQAYQIIAASGPNAAVLHYDRNNECLHNKPLVCLDAGAEWNCYASDVTRTFPLLGEWPSDYARDIYKLVERMQEECIRGMRKGVRYLSLHNLAHDIAIEGLLALGVLKNGTTLEIRHSGASKVFLPHGLGHHVGLEVHDVSEKSIMAFGRRRPHWATTCLSPCTASAPVLEVGMVVTVEPGLYFSPLALADARSQPYARFIDFDVADKYVHIGGVRIEDDILVTATGYENLTTAPKGEEMLAIIRGGQCG